MLVVVVVVVVVVVIIQVLPGVLLQALLVPLLAIVLSGDHTIEVAAWKVHIYRMLDANLA